MDTNTIQKQNHHQYEESVMSVPNRLDPASTVESMMGKALKTSAHKMALSDTETLVSHLNKGNSMAINYFRYDVARELGEVLGKWDKNIKAVYFWDNDAASTAEESFQNKPVFSLIHMIIWSAKKTKALNALIEAIDRVIVQQFRGLTGLTKLENVLDIQIIDDEDVRNRTGYAALLNSIYQPPIQLWGEKL